MMSPNGASFSGKSFCRTIYKTVSCKAFTCEHDGKRLKMMEAAGVKFVTSNVELRGEPNMI